jgi:hypothetical protein
MSQRLINHNEDLRRLRNEGYDIRLLNGWLVVQDVPFIDAERRLQRGWIATQLSLAGGVTQPPGDHTAHFGGGTPCDEVGRPLNNAIAGTGAALGDGWQADHVLSRKPLQPDGDHHEKMTRYVRFLGRYVHRAGVEATARTYPLIMPEDEESVFNYLDTATSRSGIDLMAEKLDKESIAIVGLGGTGSYILDLVAKTRVRHIHLFDGDVFHQHNAFRGPGAPSIEELESKPLKVDYWASVYSRMRGGIVAHPTFLGASTLADLQGMDFVFLALDHPQAKGPIIEFLTAREVSFIDVGMGLYKSADSSIAGNVRVTTSTPAKRNHIARRVSLTQGPPDNLYTSDIQVADLNMLNGSLAVLKWKKLWGFYEDLEHEHHSLFTTRVNSVISEDQA